MFLFLQLPSAHTTTKGTGDPVLISVWALMSLCITEPGIDIDRGWDCLAAVRAAGIISHYRRRSYIQPLWKSPVLGADSPETLRNLAKDEAVKKEDKPSCRAWGGHHPLQHPGLSQATQSWDLPVASFLARVQQGGLLHLRALSCKAPPSPPPRYSPPMGSAILPLLP